MSLCIATMETMVSSEIIQRYWSTKLLRHLETKIDLFLFLIVSNLVHPSILRAWLVLSRKVFINF